MNDTTRAAFLKLIGTDNARNAQALADIEAGTAAGSILNVEFKDAKLRLDRAVEAAWNYGRGATLAALPNDIHAPEHKDLLALHWDIHMSYVRDAIAVSKKLAKTTVQHPWVESARSFVAIVLPLAQEMEALKANIVKGRRPPPAEVLAARAAREASKNSMARGQCGCCFGDQAVLPNGNIHDHGYTLPREWMKTRSCYGRKFQPLAVSVKGPKFMVGLLVQTERDILDDIGRLHSAKTLKLQNGDERDERGNRKTDGRGRYIPHYEDITPAHPEFARVQKALIAECESHLRQCRSDLAEFRKVVAEWKPGYVFVA